MSPNHIKAVWKVLLAECSLFKCICSRQVRVRQVPAACDPGKHAFLLRCSHTCRSCSYTCSRSCCHSLPVSLCWLLHEPGCVEPTAAGRLFLLADNAFSTLPAKSWTTPHPSYHNLGHELLHKHSRVAFKVMAKTAATDTPARPQHLVLRFLRELWCQVLRPTPLLLYVLWPPSILYQKARRLPSRSPPKRLRRTPQAAASFLEGLEGPIVLGSHVHARLTLTSVHSAPKHADRLQGHSQKSCERHPGLRQLLDGALALAGGNLATRGCLRAVHRRHCLLSFPSGDPQVGDASVSVAQWEVLRAWVVLQLLLNLVVVRCSGGCHLAANPQGN